MVSVLFFEVSCQSYVSFSRCLVGCDSRLVYNIVCKAFSFEGALFLSAVTFFHVFRG